MPALVAWSACFKEDAKILARFAETETLWSSKLQALHMVFHDQNFSLDQQLGFIQKAHRAIMVHLADLGESQEIFNALHSQDVVDWNRFSAPPVDEHLQYRLADMLDIVEPHHKTALIELGDTTRILAPYLVYRLLQRGVGVDVQVYDDNARTLIFNAAKDEGVQAIGSWVLNRRLGIDARIHVSHNLPVFETLAGDSRKKKIFATCLREYREKIMLGDIRTVLTSIPTPKDAEVDGIDYFEYSTLFFRMCDQPWPEIEQAQAHLISLLNPAKKLRFTNNDGTDVACDITGFTFCNSTIKRNIPGSEVFSAPHITSMNGVVVAKGKFTVKEEQGAIAENLKLVFENGVLVSATAEKGQQHLDHALAVDEGAKRVGEIAIGTNPYLKRHLASILLAEKIGGSFHFALGDAYQMTDYLGQAVVVDNGNRSLLHWDITTMLYGKQGKIFVDDVMIMDDGFFLDPKLAVLNFGWNALPEHQRPNHWKDKT